GIEESRFGIGTASFAAKRKRGRTWRLVRAGSWRVATHYSERGGLAPWRTFRLSAGSPGRSWLASIHPHVHEAAVRVWPFPSNRPRLTLRSRYSIFEMLEACLYWRCRNAARDFSHLKAGVKCNVPHQHPGPD